MTTANSRRSDVPLDINKVIDNKGYFDKYGEWNSIVRCRRCPGKLFRGRVEVFIFKDDKVFIELYPSGDYRIPGGSFDIRRSNHNQVYNEAKEEARLIVHNILYTGCSYHKLKDTPYVSKDNKTISWDGTYNKVYVADLAGYYTGHINEYSKDKAMCSYGRFVPVSEVYNLLIPIHKTALQLKLQQLQKISN